MTQRIDRLEQDVLDLGRILNAVAADRAVTTDIAVDLVGQWRRVEGAHRGLLAALACERGETAIACARRLSAHGRTLQAIADRLGVAPRGDRDPLVWGRAILERLATPPCPVGPTGNPLAQGKPWVCVTGSNDVVPNGSLGQVVDSGSFDGVHLLLVRRLGAWSRQIRADECHVIPPEVVASWGGNPPETIAYPFPGTQAAAAPESTVLVDGVARPLDWFFVLLDG